MIAAIVALSVVRAIKGVIMINLIENNEVIKLNQTWACLSPVEINDVMFWGGDKVNITKIDGVYITIRSTEHVESKSTDVLISNDCLKLNFKKETK